MASTGALLAIEPSTRARKAAQDETPRTAPPKARPARAAHIPEEPREEEAAVAPPESLPRTEGRGGREHKYYQSLIREEAESLGWRATIEEGIPGGKGSVDVSLRKGERSIAVEIGITTTPEHEFENIRKCLAAAFEAVIFLSPEKATLRKVGMIVSSTLSEEEQQRVHVVTPEDAYALVGAIAAEAAGATQTIAGFHVNVRLMPKTKEDRTARRRALTEVMGKSAKRLKGKE